MNDDLLDALVFLKHNDKKKPNKRPTKSQEKSRTNSDPVTPTFVTSRSPKSSKTTPKFQNPVIRSQTNQASGSPRTSNNQNQIRSRASTTTPETPRSSRKDANITISNDPVVVKRGRAEYGSKKSTKKYRISESNTIANIESDESVDLDETQIQFGSQATPRNTTIRCTAGTSRNQASPRTRTIRCVAGTSRSQSNQRGSMFQAPQPSNSVFSLQSNRQDANETISLDPAIKERGQAQKFDEAFFEDSDNF